MAIVLQTDFAWPDVSLERAIVEAAGHELVVGPSVPLPAEGVEALVRAHDPAAIMTCWAQVSAEAIAAPRALKIVQRIGVGLDNIAVAAASARGAWVANVPDYCTSEVADHAVALLLDWARGTAAYDADVKRGEWNPAKATLRRVSDLTVGIFGVGRIGSATAQRLAAFGCTLLGHSRQPRPTSSLAFVTFDELLERSDAVIIHAPLTDETRQLFDAETLAKMKRGAFLINVSRGQIIDNDALLAAIVDGRLSGAGLDVIDGEPNPPRSLVERRDVIVTPHIAFSSGASLDELRRRASEEVVRVLAGERPHFPCNHPDNS